MDTHARGALAVCLLLAGCQSPMFSSFAWRNRPADAPNVAAPRPGVETAAARADLSDSRKPARPASLDRTPANDRRSAVADAMEQAREADARGQMDLARYHYQRALELDPAHADAHHALGIVADKQGDYRTAETHYLQALRHKPEDTNLLSDLGYSYLLQARRHDAEWYLREGLKYEPSHAKARGNLELLFDEQKAFATLRQLLGQREAEVRMAALFPQSATRMAAATGRSADYRFNEPAQTARGPQAAAYHEPHSVPVAPQQTWQHPAATAAAGQDSQPTTMDSLREEMERERHAAHDARHQPPRESLTAPPVEADAFTHTATESAGWAADRYDAPNRFAPQAAASPSAVDFSEQPSQFASQGNWDGLPAQFPRESQFRPTGPLPYGQWVEPTEPAAIPSQHARWGQPPYPAADGDPEPWPYAPTTSSLDSARSAPPRPANALRPANPVATDWPYDSRLPQSGRDEAGPPQPFTRRNATVAAVPLDVQRAAQQIGMEAGGLFPTLPPGHATAPHPMRLPVHSGISQAAVASPTSPPAWNNAAAWLGPAGVQTAAAWESEASAAASAPAPAAQQSSQIRITPGSRGSAAESRGSLPSAWPVDPVETRTPASYYQERRDTRPTGGPSAWPQTGYSPAASTMPAGAAPPQSTGRYDSGVTGWNGQ